MLCYALFENQTIIGGPQYVDPGGWVEVEVDETVPAGTLCEWDFTGERPLLRAKTLSNSEQNQILGDVARSTRNKLLLASDWTQMPDVTIANKAQWGTYRQELRDISNQTGFPVNFVWPTPPSTS